MYGLVLRKCKDVGLCGKSAIRRERREPAATHIVEKASAHRLPCESVKQATGKSKAHNSFPQEPQSINVPRD